MFTLGGTEPKQRFWHRDHMTKHSEIAANFSGLKVPHSPFMNERRAERINAGRYEATEIHGALAVVKNSDRVLELGAGLGVVGGACALLAQPERILSFEANPNLIPHVQELYRLNGVNDRIEVRNQLVVSDSVRAESMTFFLHNSFLGSSLLPAARKTTREVEVPTVAFEDIKSELSPTVLISDIEGGELEFLENADLTGIRAVVIEFHPKVYGRAGMQRCKSILTETGFVKQNDLSTRLVWTCVKEL
ncbi:FkbM family methyltransferase [Ruegeria sp. ANG-S4]|uniref:FkbM family methyltransferase n=1 Tax=Ruegeria sp. ANG-S4 TaxID=1577904 RepID=UPI001F4CE01C|nr:FkbM family methyltransferase [Ruegeria sp. ANG-S4]